MPRARKPGPSVKNAKQYEKLRKKGFSKAAAAAITNASFDAGHTKSGKKKKGSKSKYT